MTPSTQQPSSMAPKIDGGANNDSIRLARTTGTFTTSTLSGGLANDTIAINTATTLKDSTIYGGGTSATSSDGADSIQIGSANASFLQGNGGNDTFDIAGTSTSTHHQGRCR